MPIGAVNSTGQLVPAVVGSGQEPAAAGEQQPIVYARDEHGTVDEFKESPLFADFKQQYRRAFDQVIAFAERHDSYQRAQTVKDNFNKIFEHMFEPPPPGEAPFYGSHIDLMYSRGKESLDRICELLQGIDKPEPSVIDAIYEISVNSTECADGAVSHFCNAASVIKLNLQGGIIAGVQLVRKEIMDEVVCSYCQENLCRGPRDTYYLSMEIHYVNAIRNYPSARLQVAEQIDYFAPNNISPQLMEECYQRIEAKLVPLPLVTHLADRCLKTFTHYYHSEPDMADKWVAYQHDLAEGALDYVQHRYAKELLQSDFMQISEDNKQCRVYRDPSLIAHQLLQSMYDNRLAEGERQEEVFAQWYDPAYRAMARIEHCAEQLWWTVCQKETGFVTLAHLVSALESNVLTSCPESLMQHILLHDSDASDHLLDSCSQTTRSLIINTLLSLDEELEEKELSNFIQRHTVSTQDFILQQIACTESFPFSEQQGGEEIDDSDGLTNLLSVLLLDLLPQEFPADKVNSQQRHYLQQLIPLTLKYSLEPEQAETVNPSWLLTSQALLFWLEKLPAEKRLQYLISLRDKVHELVQPDDLKALCFLFMENEETAQQADQILEYLQGLTSYMYKLFVPMDSVTALWMSLAEAQGSEKVPALRQEICISPEWVKEVVPD